MLSKLPTELQKVSKADINKEILRIGIMAELDAVSFYEQLAAMTDNADLKKMLMHVAKEEKTHIGEFQALLLKHDAQQEEELREGEKEVREELGW